MLVAAVCSYILLRGVQVLLSRTFRYEEVFATVEGARRCYAQCTRVPQGAKLWRVPLNGISAVFGHGTRRLSEPHHVHTNTRQWDNRDFAQALGIMEAAQCGLLAEGNCCLHACPYP